MAKRKKGKQTKGLKKAKLSSSSVSVAVRSLAAEAKIEKVQDWEQAIIDNASDAGEACFHVAEKQLSVTRMRQWLHAAIDSGSHVEESAKVVDAAVLHATANDVAWLEDEAALAVCLLPKRNETLDKYTSYYKVIDPDGCRLDRAMARTFLSGCLEKNRGSPLYQSFFQSGLVKNGKSKGNTRMEESLIETVTQYLADSKFARYFKVLASGEYNEKRTLKRTIMTTCISDPMSYGEDFTELNTLVDVADHILLKEKPIKVFKVNYHSTNHLVGLLPLLSKAHPIHFLYLYGVECERDADIRDSPAPVVDLSWLVEMDTSKLEVLIFDGTSIPSLSLFSQCDLSALRCLYLGQKFTGKCDGFTSLEGLTKKNTGCLENIIIFNDDFRDVSALAECDLPLLNMLKIISKSLTDISPLGKCDLSALTAFRLQDCGVSDISALQNCNLKSVWVVNLTNTSVSDLSPLQAFGCIKHLVLENTPVEDLRPLAKCDCALLQQISFKGTRVSDLSPLAECDLRLLRVICMDNTPISDLSPLAEWYGFAPFQLSFDNCPIEDISPLEFVCPFNYADSIKAIKLNGTKVRDFSPLSGICAMRPLNVFAFDTPAGNEIAVPDKVHLYGRVTVWC